MDMNDQSFLGRYWSQLLQVYSEFTGGGYLHIYKLLFGSPPWPFWFCIHAVWCCAIVHRSCLHTPRSVANHLKQLLLSAMMALGSRELYAVVFARPSPILNNLFLFPCFLAIFALMNAVPFDLFYRLVSLGIVHYFISLWEGFNQTRYLTFILRADKSKSWKQLPIALGFVVMDQVIEFLTRPLLSGEETPMSNGPTIFRTYMFSVVFWLATNQNPLTKYIGQWDIRLSALTLGFVLGIANAFSMLRVGKDVPPERQQPVTPPASPRPKRDARLPD
jgi:hypothetical protein